MTKRLIAWLAIFSMLGCQTTNKQSFINKTKYKYTREALQKQNFAKARKKYPTKESQYFIPTLEYAWLSLLNGRVDTQRLTAMSQYLEDSKTVRIADEADRFFFKELDEYYVPGEHEIIMFHLITGLAFAQQGLKKKARVEAKRAADYLPGSFISSQYFDDPGIRMILAGLWLYSDEWQNAKANLKKASELSPKYKWAGNLAKKKQPPENFVIFLKGVGPEVVWAPEHEDSGRWGLLFVTQEDGKPTFLKTERGTSPLTYGAPTSEWYVRHFERDSLPRTVLDEIQHGARVTAGAAGAVALTTAALLGATIVVALALAGSVALIAASAKSESGGLMKIAFQFSAYMIAASFAIADETTTTGTAKAQEIYENEADESETYRFVRFLPSYIYAKPFSGVLESPKIYKQPPLLDVKSPRTRVMIFFNPT